MAERSPPPYRRRLAGAAVTALLLLSLLSFPVAARLTEQGRARTVLLRAAQLSKAWFPSPSGQSIQLPPRPEDLAYALSISLGKEWPGLKIGVGSSSAAPAKPGQLTVDRASYDPPRRALLYLSADQGRLCRLQIGVHIGPVICPRLH